MLEQYRMLEKAKISTRTRTSERTKNPDRGKVLMAQASHAPAPDCMILEQWVPPPSHVTTARECRVALASCGRNRERVAESDHSPRQSSRKKKKVLAARRSGLGDGSWEGKLAAGGDHPFTKHEEGFRPAAGATTFES
jgi:hypothetical protein